MKTLLLLRHAKSDWGDPDLADHDRVLNRRGVAAAPLMGAWITRHRLRPDFVLCSTAKRARETLGLALPRLGEAVPVHFEKGLYLAEAARLLARLRTIDEAASKVLLIGHNPGLHDLARRLAGTGPADVRGALDDKLPTAGLVVLRFDDAAGWGRIGAGTARLEAFVTPKSLA